MLSDLLRQFSVDKNFDRAIEALAGSSTLLNDFFKNLDREYPAHKNYSAWIAIHLTKRHPALVLPYQAILVDHFLQPLDESSQRNYLKCLSILPIDTYREGEILDLLIELVYGSNYKVALRVYAFEQLYRFYLKYPDLLNELQLALEELSRLKTPYVIATQKKYGKKLRV